MKRYFQCDACPYKHKCEICIRGAGLRAVFWMWIVALGAGVWVTL